QIAFVRIPWPAVSRSRSNRDLRPGGFISKTGVRLQYRLLAGAQLEMRSSIGRNLAGDFHHRFLEGRADVEETLVPFSEIGLCFVGVERCRPQRKRRMLSGGPRCPPFFEEYIAMLIDNVLGDLVVAFGHFSEHRRQ